MISVLFQIHQRIRLIISIIYFVIIALLSLLPPKDLPRIPLFEGADKIIHAMMYAGLTWLVCWMIYAEKKQLWYFLTVVLSIGWGVVMELCQLNMHLGRSFELNDILGNCIGTFVGLLVYIGMKNINSRLAFNKNIIKY